MHKTLQSRLLTDAQWCAVLLNNNISRNYLQSDISHSTKAIADETYFAYLFSGQMEIWHYYISNGVLYYMSNGELESAGIL